MIELKKVTIKYVPDITTLLNFSAKIDCNTLIIGDEFLGTSSILRLIAKIDKNYTGEILIDNANLKEIKDKDLSVAYLPKEPYLFKNTIEKNLSYPLKIRKIDKATIKEKVSFVINYLNNLTKKHNIENFPNKIKKMNISEKKIGTLLRALVRAPKYVLLDDFFLNLDAKYFPLANELIEKLKQTSTIIATSNKAEQIYKDFNIIDLTK